MICPKCGKEKCGKNEVLQSVRKLIDRERTGKHQ